VILQLFIFAALFAVFGIFSIIRKKRLLGFTFLLLGLMLFTVAAMVVYLYPEKSPF
jgi:predicted membrane channel-forming protein YqfA (hemolysin III family)